MEPVIKVRHKIWILVWTLLALTRTEAGISKCNKTPREQTAPKTIGDHGFAVTLNGSPRLYRPNQIYTITLKGYQEDGFLKFQDFILVAEPARGSVMMDAENLGTFQLMPGDAMSKFSHLCSHAVEATSSLSKESVQIYWTAPSRGAGCIDFKAMIVERPDVWFMDDGGLTYSVCEDDSTMAEPQAVDPCCACDEAKYEVIFEGIWSRHTHPKDFPRDEWRTQFSTLIGASHSANYSLWDYGEMATGPLQALGERGRTRPLEAQMKRFSQSIRSVIKAQGLQQRSNVAGQTFAVFRVDRTHHLLSLVSKMIPSPDFIVGISKENLCMSNCSWIPYRVIDLYPWDIGTDRGVKYDSQPNPQRPRGNIQRITSSNPENPDSPFYDETSAPMKPAARLHIIRQRIYKKNNCPNINMGGDLSGINSPGNMNPSWVSGGMGENPRRPNNGGSGDYSSNYEGDMGVSYTYGTGIGPNTNTYDTPTSNANDYDNYDTGSVDEPIGQPDNSYDIGGRDDYDYPSSDPCEVSNWSMWSKCSHTCDRGSRSRNRKYNNDMGAGIRNCRQPLFEKEICPDLPKCQTMRYGGNFDLFESQGQLRSSWALQGPKEKVRYRGVDDDFNRRSYVYQNPSNSRRRMQDNPRNSYVYQGSSDHNSYQYPKQSRLLGDDASTDSLMDDDIVTSVQNCVVTPWGEWSDCSASCENGRQTRTRRYAELDKSHGCGETLDDVRICLGNSPSCPVIRRVPPPDNRVNRPNRRMQKRLRFSESDPECDVSQWSSWSPCSKKCENGYKLRTRLYLKPFVPNRSCDVKLFDKVDCFGSSTDCPSYLSDSRSGSELYDIESDVGNHIGIIHEHEEENHCALRPDPGPCRGHYSRWYYDKTDNTCSKFVFRGCEGNRNNFASEEACVDTCRIRSTKDWQDSRDDVFSQLQSLSFIKLQDEPARDTTTTTRPPVDCQVSSWSSWSSCSTACGSLGWHTRMREVLIPPSNGGRHCPKKLIRRRKCSNTPCSASDHTDWYQGSWRNLVGDE